MSSQSFPEIDRGNWRSYAATGVNPKDWTAIIAAAGKGSRLGYHLPKILYPVCGRPILAWLLDLVAPFCETTVLVLAPDGREVVEPALESLAPGRFRIAIQPEPKGMGDAVEVGLSQVGTRNTAVMWGDQVALRAASVQAVMRLHAGPLEPGLTVPTVFRDAPYIHFERGPDGVISQLLQLREGDSMPQRGESDTGFFCFETTLLRSLLAELRGQTSGQGARTAEFNLLPVIPLAASAGYRVLTPHVMDEEETIGINSAADVQRVESYLRGAYA
jgi:bifunctional UDP-N-acetylglucosamine pyrophosphorylase/glucosamine-1-phosphate N-acetyltransferase